MDPRGQNPFYESAIVDDDSAKGTNTTSSGHLVSQSPLPRSRSFSDGGPSGPKLSPSPNIIAAASSRRTKDDIALKDTTISTPASLSASTPSTPCRDEFPRRGLNLQAPPNRDFTSPGGPTSSHQPGSNSPYFAGRVAPLSPKLDPSQVFASPTNILPRRSRGLDFSRAATSLHHSMLADQSSPDSSPTMGGRAMNIPNRRSGDFSSTEQSSNSLWSVMGSQERMNLSGSLGSVPGIVPSDSSSSSDDDVMDEDMDESYLTTPQAKATISLGGPQPAPWSLGGSPAVSSLMNFQQRQRPKKHPKRRLRAGLGLGGIFPSGVSKSPPNGMAMDVSHSRRESISWQANQLHLSGSEGEDVSSKAENPLGTPSRDRSVIRRVVTRRGNLFVRLHKGVDAVPDLYLLTFQQPKTKGFARIRAALAEESAPVEAEICREAEVVRQVLESDVPYERGPTAIPPLSAPTTTNSSPSLKPQDDMDDMITDSGLGISSTSRLQQQQQQQQPPPLKGLLPSARLPWDAAAAEPTSNTSSAYTTPPLPPFRPRGSSTISEDMSMDSQSGPFSSSTQPQPPSAAEITRRINNKRRRDDDLDPVALKRRAVSPSVSVHNSPVMQSPMQRDAAPWGSRPGSNCGDRGGSSAASDSGSIGGTPGSVSVGATGRIGGGGKGRVGFQGMVDTSDGMMRMSIE